MDKKDKGYWTEAPSAATFDILERYAVEHPELKAGFSRSTGGVDVDLVVAVFANDLRAARKALRGPLSVEKCSKCGNNWEGQHDDWCPFRTLERREAFEKDQSTETE